MSCATVSACVGAGSSRNAQGLDKEVGVRLEHFVHIQRKTRHIGAMTRDDINAICATFPGAELSDPWGGGHDAWKIGGKMFASIGVKGDGVSVKTPDVETAALLIEVGAAEKAPYFHRSWVRVQWEGADPAEMADRLAQSYDIVRSGLTKKFQATLAPRA
ncbi:MmcQ/YjbR family DNA-binding protein [Ascidiaceihabitans sp.]|uniref:MmcQ/YjbR family DNA-binding protein n=1 Tax=Ascidiaceihabitans sp. TaxID=1872644 RepID=UPI00329877FE